MDRAAVVQAIKDHVAADLAAIRNRLARQAADRAAEDMAAMKHAAKQWARDAVNKQREQAERMMADARKAAYPPTIYTRSRRVPNDLYLASGIYVARDRPKLQPSVMSFLLPWEIIERIIELASDNLDLLRSFSLTCRQLRPRSFSLILGQYVFIYSPDRAIEFCSFLREQPQLQPLVLSITISPINFRPFPLMKLLPRLSTLHFFSRKHKVLGTFEDVDPNNQVDDIKEPPAIALHSTILRWCRSSGTGIRTLFLDHLCFQTRSELFKLLLAFPHATKITCNNIRVKSSANQAFAVEMVGSKLSKQLRIEALHVRIHP